MVYVLDFTPYFTFGGSLLPEVHINRNAERSVVNARCPIQKYYTEEKMIMGYPAMVS